MARLSRAPWVLAVLATLTASSCGGRSQPAPTSPSGVMSAEARAYLEHAVSLMQAHSYKRLSIDWDAFRSTVFARVPAAQSTPDTYPGIALGTTLLADNHSTFATPSGYVLTPRTRSCSAPDAGRPAVPANIGYVKVGTFSGIGDAALAYADQLQRAIAAADAARVTAWIVDVRGNGGGNMWPMLASDRCSAKASSAFS